MRPGPFEYSRPRELKLALEQMARGAVPLAGGQSLIQSMRLRQVEPQLIVDLGDVSELSNEVSYDTESVVIGARATHRCLAQNPMLNREFPWLGEAARELGDVQVRNLGTTLGNVCWADPRANMAIALLASDATIECVNNDGEYSTIPIAEFFTGFRSNALNGRLATAIRLQHESGMRGCYLEFSRQRQDLALVNVAAVNRNGRYAVAVGGIDQRPRRVELLEQQLGSSTKRSLPGVEVILDHISAMSLNPIADHYGTAEYKQTLAATLIHRALGTCVDGA